MRQTQLFSKTQKEFPKGEESRNAQLLEQAGFVYKNLAGIYSYLPLGLRVLNKIVRIIREEMDGIDGQEVVLNALQDPEVWKKTDRWNDEKFDVWFKTKLKNDSELGLSATHEEPLTELMKHQITSYKDLPVYVYQFQTKFRNELRTKSGLMRAREFLMKDLYSFDKNEAEHKKYYEKVAGAYMRIFTHVGLGEITYRTFASGGAFSRFSDEFQTLSDAGEDIIYVDKEKRIAVNKEVYNDELLNELGLDKQKLEQKKAIEVGNIFTLGTRFSEALDLNYTDESGEAHPVFMGSYGIGPGRVIGAIVETHNDEKGIIWPEAVAPFRVHLLNLSFDDDEKTKYADEVYRELSENSVEVLYDDRNESAGKKFADADLIGIPYRIVISKRTENQIEIKRRDSEQLDMIDRSKLIDLLKTKN